MVLSTPGFALEFKAMWPQNRSISAEPWSLQEAPASDERQGGPKTLCRGLCLRLMEGALALLHREDVRGSSASSWFLGTRMSWWLFIEHTIPLLPWASNTTWTWDSTRERRMCPRHGCEEEMELHELEWLEPGGQLVSPGCRILLKGLAEDPNMSRP